MSLRAVAVVRRAELVRPLPAPRLAPDLEPLDLPDLEPPDLVAIELLLRVAAIDWGN
ncbi:MAG: hypothetical protein AABM66_00155 [Actinomycetota bacterium]